MGIINALFGGSGTGGRNKIMLDISLGNVLLAGSAKRGIEHMMSSIAISAINNDRGVVIFRNENKGFSYYPDVTTQRSRSIEFNSFDDSICSQFSPFKHLDDNKYNTMLIKLFDSYQEVEKSKKMIFMRYLSLLRKLIKLSGKTAKINNLIEFSIDKVEEMNDIFIKNLSEKNSNISFLNSIRPDVSYFESYFYEFSTNVVGNVLSGNQSLEDIFKKKDIIEVNLDFISHTEESIVLMSLMIDLICQFNFSLSDKNGIQVLADEIPNDVLIKCGFQKLIRSSNNCNVIYSISDLYNLCEKDNSWIEYADSYFFFRQNSNKNTEACSLFFGDYDRHQQSVTKGATKSSFMDYINGRGQSSTTNSVTDTIVKDRVYRPDVFAKLPDNQAIFFLKKFLYHNYITLNINQSRR